MQKIELLTRIQELSSLLSSDTTTKYMQQETVQQMQQALEQMTQKYLDVYCMA